MTERKSFTIKGKYHKPRGGKVATKTFPDLNDLLNYSSRSRYSYSRVKKEYMDIAILSIRVGLKNWKAKGKVRLHFYFCEPSDGHYRDYDNISSAAHKIIIDALVKHGTIVDDSPKYLLPSVNHFAYTKNTPYIKVEIEEIND